MSEQVGEQKHMHVVACASCGSNPAVQGRIGVTRMHIECPKCGARGPVADAIGDAVRGWNRLMLAAANAANLAVDHAAKCELRIGTAKLSLLSLEELKGAVERADILARSLLVDAVVERDVARGVVANLATDWPERVRVALSAAMPGWTPTDDDATLAMRVLDGVKAYTDRPEAPDDPPTPGG